MGLGLGTEGVPTQNGDTVALLPQQIFEICDRIPCIFVHKFLPVDDNPFHEATENTGAAAPQTHVLLRGLCHYVHVTPTVAIVPSHNVL